MNWQVQLSRAPAARLDPFSCVTAVSLTVVPSLLIIRTLIIRTPSSLVTGFAISSSCWSLSLTNLPVIGCDATTTLPPASDSVG